MNRAAPLGRCRGAADLVIPMHLYHACAFSIVPVALLCGTARPPRRRVVKRKPQLVHLTLLQWLLRGMLNIGAVQRANAAEPHEVEAEPMSQQLLIHERAWSKYTARWVLSLNGAKAAVPKG